MNRIGQFFRAVFARLAEEDVRYIRDCLPLRGQELFFRMNLADQYHALHVARTAEGMAGESVDRVFLLRCALLHDVGRTKEDMGVWGKVVSVLLDSLAPKASRRWAQEKRGYLGHLMHVYYYHPEIGAEMLAKAGFPEEADIVRFHHQPPREEDSPVLRILKEADARN